MKAIVIGGTGATGKVLVKKLIDTSWVTDIVVLVRRTSFDEHPKLQQIKVNFDKLNEYAQYITGDIAFSCLGTTLKMAGSKEAQWVIDHDYQYNFGKICKTNDVTSFVLLSALNADPDSSSFYGKMKGALEKNISELNFNKLIIFQPSFLIRPDSSRALENMGVKVMLFLNKIGIGRAFAPLHVGIIAQAMINSSIHCGRGKTILKVAEINEVNKVKIDLQ